MIFSDIESINIDVLNEMMGIFYYSSLIPIRFIDTNLKIQQVFPEENILDFSIFTDEKIDYEKFVHVFSKWGRARKYFYYTNDYQLSYVSVGLWHKKIFRGVLTAGPFLLLSPDSLDIDKLIEKHKMTLSMKPTLMQFYNELKVVDHNRLLYLSKFLITLVENKINLFDIHSLNNKEIKNKAEEVLSYQIIKNREENLKRNPYILSKDLYDYVKSGDLSNAKKIKDKLSKYEMVELPGVDPIRNAKNYLIIHCSSLARSVIEGGVDADFVYTLKDTYLRLIESCNNLTQLITISNSVLEEFVESVTKLGLIKVKPSVQKAIKYIYEHLTEEISLEQVAKKVKLHPKYLSALFKKEMGITFQNYILKLRIQEAKRLLNYSDYSILDIALQFGFKSQSYFTNTFKKYEGCTPNQYRKKKITHNKFEEQSDN
ncbi:AraC family transcriptional regulator [Oceanirhabdus seepicola]|uniref:Helix-turn-helix transcriptional regulator n=1 Tax=Oceanirhabdus seepicola TaxID=2828781 RepID=A0A9J6P9V3_9CLOT|nr:AraC family transcriptional regulator [Oceanirhabdus seepicola]MCM1992205.1 helix-turn-helix transcriptional regulator [Oceanirhabdus seepicola]